MSSRSVCKYHSYASKTISSLIDVLYSKPSFSPLDNVHVGEPCIADEQCTGTAMSGICKNSTCICAKGYFSQGQHCYEGEVSKPLNESKDNRIFSLFFHEVQCLL